MRLRTPYFYYWYRLRLSYLVALFVFAFIYLDRFSYGILIGTLYSLLSACHARHHAARFGESKDFIFF